MKLVITMTVTSGISHQRSVRRVLTPIFALVRVVAVPAGGMSSELLTGETFRKIKREILRYAS